MSSIFIIYTVIISFCWALGIIIGFLPLFGWRTSTETNTCLFVKIMDYNYLLFLYFATIITPALLLLAFYVHIYTIIMKQVSQLNIFRSPIHLFKIESLQMLLIDFNLFIFSEIGSQNGYYKSIHTKQ